MVVPALGSLADAAFGADPGRWPLPTARTGEELWLRAVAAGGQGRYGSARADLGAVLRDGGPLSALACATLGSFLRQQGWHEQAARYDGRALTAAAGDVEAAVDALVGLAADSLGVGRLARSAALLGRAQRLHDDADAVPPRPAVRLAWVRAELAMAAGQGHAAVAHAREARELVARQEPALRRHAVKSQVVLAAALCSLGEVEESRAVADAALIEAGEHGLVPLRWALACLLADIGSDRLDPAEVGRIRTADAGFVVRHGGRWNSR